MSISTKPEMSSSIKKSGGGIIVLRLYMTAKKTVALGPYKRYVIWVQGCNRRCKNCLSPESRDLNGGYEEPVARLAQDIIRTRDIEGITISGGEPFLQAQALTQLISKIKAERDLGVILYTGNKFSDIKNEKLSALCDIIIDDEYIDELNDNLSLRGSSNQNIYLLSDRYKDIAPKIYGVPGRKMEMYFQEKAAFMIGIPSREATNIIKEKVRNC